VNGTRIRRKLPRAAGKKGERTIVYLWPGADGFLASFAMGTGALARAAAKIRE
jgi:hypothetical protein